MRLFAGSNPNLEREPEMLELENGSVVAFDCGCEYVSGEAGYRDEIGNVETYFYFTQSVVCPKGCPPPFEGFRFNTWKSDSEKAMDYLREQVGETH